MTDGQAPTSGARRVALINSAITLNRELDLRGIQQEPSLAMAQ